MEDKDLTSFCGLWCNDCIPANERLYALTAELFDLLNEIGFKNYADFKWNKVPEFKDYDKFISVLNAFEKLHCYNHCRKGPFSEAGCAPSCEIRVCVTEKGYQGCWECDSYALCEHIKRLERFHPEIIHNLQMINKYDIDSWKIFRGRHYNWSKERTE